MAVNMQTHPLWSMHVRFGLSTPLNHGTCLQPNSTFICHPVAGPTVHQDRLLRAYFPVFSAVCLKLAATDSSDQQLSVFKYRLTTQTSAEH